MPSVHIYIRVSSKKQNEYNNISLDMQLAKCMEYFSNSTFCNTHNTVVYSEVVSARYLANQTNLLKLFEKLTDGDVILVYNVSRFSRDSAGAIDLLYNKLPTINIISVNEGISYPANRNSFRIKLVEANEESDVISDRVRGANEYIKSKGGHIGSTKYGYSTIRQPPAEGETYSTRVLVENEREMKVIKRIVNSVHDLELQQISEQKQVGVCNVIADILNEEQITKRGALWNAFSVLAIYKKYKSMMDDVIMDNDDDDVNGTYDDTICVLCSGNDSLKGNEMLLCDGCNRGFHLQCIQFDKIPVENFYCSIECKIHGLKTN